MSSASIDSVISKLSAKTADPSLEACLLTVQTLPPQEKQALGDHQPVYTLTAEDKEKFTRAVIQAFSSATFDQELGNAANGAYDAAKNLLELMVAFVLNCVCYDQAHGSNLTDIILTPILTSYVKTMVQSVPFARQVAAYGEGFDNEVIAFCANESLSIDRRLSKIQEYIRDAENFETQARQIQQTLNYTQDQLVLLAAEISKGKVALWEKPSSPVPNQKITTVSKPPFETGITLVDSLMSTPLRRLMMICGLLGVENDDAFIAAYSIAANDALQAAAPSPTSLTILHELRSVEVMNDALEKYFDEFRDNVAVLNSYWNSTIVDARNIESWLKDGASYAEFPEYMELNLKEGVRTYVKIGRYLRSYADQIDSLHYDELLKESGYA